MMEVDHIFCHRINGETVRETVLEKADVSLMMQGIGYAKEKEFTTKRKNAYRDLMARLNVVIRGKARWSRRTI